MQKLIFDIFPPGLIILGLSAAQSCNERRATFIRQSTYIYTRNNYLCNIKIRKLI